MEEITVSKTKYRMLKIYAVLLSIALIGLMVTGYIKERHFRIIDNFKLRPDNVYVDYTCLDLGVVFTEDERGATAFGACCKNNSTECLLRIFSCPDPRDMRLCKTNELELNPPKAIKIKK
jgi:predicted amidohydrolase